MNYLKYDYGLFIGRFQPFHVGHLHNIRYGLLFTQKIIVLIGSSFRAPSIKNPFSYEERRDMILSDLQASEVALSRIIVEPLSDWFYNEDGWRNEVKLKVNQHVNLKSKIVIIGHEKDASSYYLRCFPNFKHVSVTKCDAFNATDFRVLLFNESRLDKNYLINNNKADGTYKTLQRYMMTEKYQALCQDFKYIIQYKPCCENTLFKSVFITTEAMVLCNKHLLLIQRKKAPGKNLWTLPGRFLDPDGRIIDGILRELEEKMAVVILSSELSQTFMAQEFFDHPDRSSHGRLITYLNLFWLCLPSV